MYQFIHVESYARSAPKTAKTSGSGKAGKNINYVIAEANREAGAHPHIDAPEPPVVLFGEPLENIESMAEQWAGSVKDASGRKLRKDGLCLLAGVISAPSDIPNKDWDKFKNESVAYLQNKYGDCLKTVIEHTDESHPHLHFYVIPEHGQAFNTVHQGRAASAKVKAESVFDEDLGYFTGAKGAQNRAYKAAMREFQDEFYNAVGMQNGMARLGPGKRRLTREEWKLEQVQAENTAKTIQKIDKKLEVTKIKAQKITAQTLKKVDLIKNKAEKEGFNKGLDKVEKMSWFKRLSTVFARAVGERDSLKEEVKTLKNENSENAEKSESLLKRAKNYFKTAKKLEAKIAEIEPIAKSAERYKRENNDLKRENNELGQQLGTARTRVQHLEAAYLPAETAETANSNKIARKHENTHSNSAKRSSSSSNSGGSGGDAQLAESRARAARYENEFGGLGI